MARLTKAQRSRIARKAARTRKRNAASRPRRRTPSRRKSGSLGGFSPDLMTPIGGLVGGIGGTALDKIIPASLDPKIVAGGKMALGVLASQMDNPLLKGLGAAMTGIGASELMAALGVLGAPPSDGDLFVSLDGADGYTDVLAGDDLDVINGDDDLDVINGDDDLDVINGYELEEEDFIIQ